MPRAKRGHHWHAAQKVYEKDKKRRKIESVVDCTCRPSQSFGRPLKQTADCPEMALVGK
jgi:hypothetical protein